MKCANLKKGRSLRDGDSKCFQEAKDFITLYVSEFMDRLASAAHVSYRLRGNSLSEFPDEADLRLLRECQVKRMKVLMEATPGTEVEWRELAELKQLLNSCERCGGRSAAAIPSSPSGGGLLTVSSGGGFVTTSL